MGGEHVVGKLAIATLLVVLGAVASQDMVSRGTVFLEYAPSGVLNEADEMTVHRFQSAELRDWRVIRVPYDMELGEFVQNRIERGAAIIVRDAPIWLAGVDVPTEDELWPMWGLRNIGQPTTSMACAKLGESLLDWDIQADDVTTNSGCGVTVIIPDTGLDGKHPQLAHALWEVHWTPSGEVQVPSDDPGIPHGSHVAGTIAAAVDGRPPVGVSPCAKVVSVDVFRGRSTTVATILLGLDWVIENTKRGRLGRVVALNASWIGSGSPVTQVPLKKAFQALANLDITLVVAAGNKNELVTDKHFPASWTDIKELITVGAYAPDGRRACFSNYSTELVHVGAPGVGILSTTTHSGTATWDGTSMAAPHVTGAVARLRAEFPELRASQLREILSTTARSSPVEESVRQFASGMIDLQTAREYAEVFLRSRR